jgi:cytoskeleton protein RodZ
VFEIGSTLREARVRRKLTLQQVEDDTKIRVKYVQAMENEDFDVMPGSTYVKGFLRTYATYLGIDPEVIIDEYRSRAMPREDHEPFGGSSALGRPTAHRARNNLLFVAIVAVLIIVVLSILGLNHHPKTSPGARPGALGLPSTSPKPSVSHTAKPEPTGSATKTSSFSFTIKATGGASWLQATIKTAIGTTVKTVTLADGQSLKLSSAGPVDLQVANPPYLSVTIDHGKAQQLQGTGTKRYQLSSTGIRGL